MDALLDSWTHQTKCWCSTSCQTSSHALHHTKGHHIEGRGPCFNARSLDVRRGFEPRPDLHMAWHGVHAANIGIARQWCSPPWRCSYAGAHSTVRQPCRSPTSHAAARIVAALSSWLHAPLPSCGSQRSGSIIGLWWSRCIMGKGRSVELALGCAG
jgi:hypothetical protein